MAIGHKTTAAISSVVTAAVLISASSLAPKNDFREPEAGQRSGQWPAVRKAFLATHPTCAACGTTDDLEVHHVEVFKLHPEKELLDSNLIVLCRKPGHLCHLVFGHNYSFFRSNPHVREDAARQLKRVQENKKTSLIFLRFRIPERRAA